MAEFILRLGSREHKILDGALKDVLSFYEDVIAQIDYTKDYTKEEIEQFDHIKQRHALVNDFYERLWDVYGFDRCEINLTDFDFKKGKNNGKARS